MASARGLHDNTFLKLACWWEEGVFGAAETMWPSYLPPPDELPKGASPWFASVLAAAADRYQSLRYILEQQERARLRDTGLSARALATEPWRSYLQEQVKLRLVVEHARHAEKDGAHRRFSSDEPWTPARATVVDLIVGVYFTVGDTDRSRTAKLLNRGLPRDKRNAGVTPSEVRNALFSFLTRLANRDFESVVLVTRCVAFRTLLLDRMWTRCVEMQEFRLLSGPQIADRLAEGGTVFRWESDAVSDLGFPEIDRLHLARMIVLNLTEWHRRALRKAA